MSVLRFSLKLAACLAISLMFASTATHHASAQSVVFDFTGADGSSPQGGVIFDRTGNIYGTTLEGGTDTNGTVFELSNDGGGAWSEQILHSFNVASPDGNDPASSSLTLTPSGTLYGTTEFGGARLSGVAYLLVHSGTSWVQKIIHTFDHSNGDGFNPVGTMLLDASGNLYGATTSGGADGYGTVFEIVVAKNGLWTEKILYSFKNDGHDGNSPFCDLIFDQFGNIFGTTALGGAYGGGTVFELLPKSGGGWTEKILYSFHKKPDGDAPNGGVVLDSAGNLYGTTYRGGVNNFGTAFRLTPRSSGGWQKSTLYSFTSSDVGISGPANSLALDTAGNLYGTILDGGANGVGSIFKLTATSGGMWTESTFYSFEDGTGGPAFPSSGLMLGPDGKFYGASAGGGSVGLGTVYSIAP